MQAPSPAVPPAPAYSRRQVLFGGRGTAAAPNSGLASPAIDARWLLARATFGFREVDRQRVQAIGPAEFLTQQLEPSADDDTLLDARLAAYPSLGMTSRQLYDNYVIHGQKAVPVLELKAARLLRACYSAHQLFERTVEFWTDHFNVDQLKNQCQAFKTVDDREVIRRHAFGRFPELLRASAHSAAMLFYLDNISNTRLAPQENYARELLELHTLGADGPYTETDVRELARCLTGWTREDLQSARFGEFRFDPAMHDFGAKNVLGLTIPAGGGQSDAELVLDNLASHPATARFIAKKLLRFFVAPEPGAGEVQRIANVFLATGGDVRAMLRAMLDPAQASDLVPAPKHRRPLHMVASLVRAFDLELTDPRPMIDELLPLGHQPYAWPSPNGYPDTLAAWGASVMPRWRLAARLFDGQIAGVLVSPAAIQARLAAHPGSLARAIDQVLTGGSLLPAEVARIDAFVQSFPGSTWPVVREAIALAASAPSYSSY